MIDILHLFSQLYCHSDAWVVGTMDGLIKLRDALTRVIDTGEPQVAHTYTSDGEGYCALVIPLTGQQMYDMALPYTHENLEGDSEQLKFPAEFLDRSTYIKLVREHETLQK